MYAHRCQICDVRLDFPSEPISIGAHIKGLGQPNNGPDVLPNLLCLCPNHHNKFDYFSYFIEPNTLEIKELKGFEGKIIKVHSEHKIDIEFLDYQKQKYLKNN